MNKVLVLSVVFATLTAATAMSISSVLAISCIQCAKEFAPGQEKFAEDSDFKSKSAREFAPGQEAEFQNPGCAECNGASELAPGQRKLNSVT